MLSCDIYTGVPFGPNSWLTINLLIILATFLVITAVYLISRWMPDSTKAKFTGIIKIEVSQAILSIIIIGILFASATTICAVVQNEYNSLPTVTQAQYPQPAAEACAVATAGIIPIPCPINPVSQTTINSFLTTLCNTNCDMFDYAEAYVGDIGFGVAPQQALSIYIDSINLGILSGTYTAIADILSDWLPALTDKSISLGGFTVGVSFPVGADFGVPYGLLSDVLVDVFIPINMIAIAVMFVQYIALIVIRSYAFTAVLPIAIVLRSFAFTGQGMRNAANSVLAFAIALYLIYPLTIAFDNYIFNWLFTACPNASGCNPSAPALCSSYTIIDTSCDFQSGISTSGINIGGVSLPNPVDILSGLESLGLGAATGIANLGQAGNSGTFYGDIITAVNSMAELIFQSVVLFALDLTITLGFAMGLTKALNNGIEGAASFWSAI